MKYLAMIQARMGSTRLPGKVLMDLCGKTALERMLDRVLRSKLTNEVMVVTSLNEEDKPIVKLVSNYGLRVFAGSADDVLDRYYQAAKLIKPEYVIRLTADCPVFDPQVLDDAIAVLKRESDALGMYSETFPDGLDLEIVRFEALEDAWMNARLTSEREHVTVYFRNHPELFSLQDFTCDIGNLHKQRWTLDEPADYKMIKSLYEHFLPNVMFGIQEIYEYLEKHPEIKAINAGIIRNEGLTKSLAKDKVVVQ